MQNTYTLRVAGLTRQLHYFPLTEKLYIAGFVMFGDVELTERCAAELLKICPPYDMLIVAESKGVPLAYEMAKQNGDEIYFVARKQKKLYMRDIFSVEVQSITTEAMQTLYLDGADAAKIRGRRILVVDDVISTGGTISTVERLIEKAGGIVAGRAAVLAEGDAIERKDIVYLAPLPLFTEEDVFAKNE